MRVRTLVPPICDGRTPGLPGQRQTMPPEGQPRAGSTAAARNCSGTAFAAIGCSGRQTANAINQTANRGRVICGALIIAADWSGECPRRWFAGSACMSEQRRGGGGATSEKQKKNITRFTATAATASENNEGVSMRRRTQHSGHKGNDVGCLPGSSTIAVHSERAVGRSTTACAILRSSSSSVVVVVVVVVVSDVHD